MASRDRIDAYRARRRDTLLSDDMIAWELDAAPDCAAEIPAEFKAELEWAADDGDLHLQGSAFAAVAATASLALYDYASSPHGGRWKPLPDHGHEPAISPRVDIHHSIVGSGAGAWAYFANSTSLESTNIVLKSGELWQCMSRREQADANYRANDFAISTETEDNGNPNTDPWTPQQVDTLVWLATEDIRDFGIPRRICPEWDAGGVGYHSLFGAPSQWTPVAGKTCPGTVRIRQWHEQVIPRILGTLQEDDQMTDEQLQQILGRIDRAVQRVGGRENSVYASGNPDFAGLVMAKDLQPAFTTISTRLSTLLDDEAKVVAAVSAVTDRVGASEQAVLGALAALDLDLSDEQIAAIAAAVNVDEAAVAEAVRFRLYDALEA